MISTGVTAFGCYVQAINKHIILSTKIKLIRGNIYEFHRFTVEDPTLWNKQKQQRVAVGPGNVHFISIRQVSSARAGTIVWPAAAAAVLLLLLPLIMH